MVSHVDYAYRKLLRRGLGLPSPVCSSIYFERYSSLSRETADLMGPNECGGLRFEEAVTNEDDFALPDMITGKAYLVDEVFEDLWVRLSRGWPIDAEDDGYSRR